MRLFLSLIFGLIGAAVAAAALYFSDSVGFYLIILMPVLAGVIVGGASSLPILGIKASPFALLVNSLLCGLLAMALYWGAQYLFLYRNVIITAYVEEGLTHEQADTLLAEVEQKEFGVTGFQAFVTAAAREGISISRVGSSNSGSTPIKDEVAYLYWAAEICIVVAIAMSTVLGRNRNRKIKGEEPPPMPAV
jgi:hypothetical protein